MSAYWTRFRAIKERYGTTKHETRELMKIESLDWENDQEVRAELAKMCKGVDAIVARVTPVLDERKVFKFVKVILTCGSQAEALQCFEAALTRIRMVGRG